MRCLLGIDLGTSSCKVALLSFDGTVLAQATRSYAVHYPKPGWAEQNPDEWWASIVKAIKYVLEQRPDAKIACIGVDGQSWSTILMDGKGNVLAPTPIWMDTRAQDECKEIAAAIGEDALFENSGNPLQPSYTLPKILWFKRHLPSVFSKAEKILQSNSFIVYRLTGAATFDESQCYGLQIYNMKNGKLNLDMLKELSIQPDLIPQPIASHCVVGGVSKNAAQETGLLQGTPVVAGGLDAACATLGAGVYQSGQTQEQGGQAGGMSICLDSYIADRRLILGRHVVPGLWLLQGGTVGGGGVLRWMKEQFCLQERMEAQQKGTSPFDEMNQRAQSIAPGCDGLLFLPYMAGERSPIWNPRAKGVWYGLDFSKTRAHLIRACMEGVGYSLRHNLEVAIRAGAKVGKLYAMGGSANSLVWTQIKSDITGCEIDVPSSDKATVLGAALLAGVGAGVYSGFEEAVNKTVSITRTHTPDLENASCYNNGYERYLALYEHLRPMEKMWP